jgi:hypothetical protein
LLAFEEMSRIAIGIWLENRIRPNFSITGARLLPPAISNRIAGFGREAQH